MYITRHVKNNKFIYNTNSKEDLERIRKLRIPPAWKNVKIDKNKNSKLQVTGYDDKNRKQYIYNEEFVEKNKKEKFKKIKDFDYNRYNKVVKKYMDKKDCSKECVIANMLKLMEDLNIRVGNESYKKENGSYGITTLLKKHLSGNKLCFIGKKGIKHEKIVTNKDSLNFLKEMKKTDGPNLFYYNKINNINSSDINLFLREKVQSNISSKDIRTYCANKLFLNYMKNVKKSSSEKENKKNVIMGIDYTAEKLGNTRKICKDSYLSPENINKFL